MRTQEIDAERATWLRDSHNFTYRQIGQLLGKESRRKVPFTENGVAKAIHRHRKDHENDAQA